MALTFADGARRKGQALEWHADTTPGAAGCCSIPARLRQVLLNLVGNGVKFTEAGTVSIRARVVESRPDAQRIEIVVKDSGIGISPRTGMDCSSRSCRPRRRLAQPRRHRSALAISRRLAELMNGSLTLASEAGPGHRPSL